MTFIKCLRPHSVRNRYTGEQLMVSCNECDSCRDSRSKRWITRLQLEARQWKYVVFFTLTYKPENRPFIDVLTEHLDDDEFQNIVHDFTSFCKYYDFKIPCVSVRDCQLFVKRLRKFLYSYEPIKEQQILRYYISSEYGPTSFLPHYHGILFFNSETLAANVAENIYKAWSYYNRSTRTWESIGRIDVQFVSSSAVQYVAKYNTFISKLPRILQSRYFRPFSIYSKNPPIGSHDFSDSQVREIFHRGLTGFSFVSPGNNEVVTVSLWRSFKDRLFPKIKGFSQFNTYERTLLYGLAFETRFESDKQVIKDYLLHRFRYHDDYLVRLLEYLFGSLDSDDDFVNTSFDFDSFWRLYLISCRVCVFCGMLNVTLNYYVSRIELYYSNCEKEYLKSQLQDEDDFVRNYPEYLSYLPYLIDPLFGDNSRLLPLSTLFHYRKMFNLSDNENKDIKNLDIYRLEFDRAKNVFGDSHKTRVKNEYVDMHPELKTLLFTLNRL